MSLKTLPEEAIFHSFSIKDKQFLLEYTRVSKPWKIVHVEFYQKHMDKWSQDVLCNLSSHEAVSLFKYIQNDGCKRLLCENMVIFSAIAKNDARVGLYSKIANSLASRVKVNKTILKQEGYDQTFFLLYRDNTREFTRFDTIHGILEKHNLLCINEKPLN